MTNWQQREEPAPQEERRDVDDPQLGLIPNCTYEQLWREVERQYRTGDAMLTARSITDRIWAESEEA